ncbi:hypothetical protein BKA62DRAFT_788211, partial [Auriculariales sp. MPI-PUGE-AT-0066]
MSSELVPDKERCRAAHSSPSSSPGSFYGKTILGLPQLSSARAVYEGFKVVVQGLAGMTNGAPWLWKAVPQTLLQFATMVERSLNQPKRIQGLVDKIAQQIGFLLSVNRSSDSNNIYIEVFRAFIWSSQTITADSTDQLAGTFNASSYDCGWLRKYILSRHFRSPTTSRV